VRHYLASIDGTLIAEYTEIETGKRSDRPELQKALTTCRRQKAKLVIAKLDRLSRNVAFIATMMDSGVEFVACDNPHATRLTLHILAAVAEHEREMIAARTKAALQAAKARGIRLGRHGADYLAQANKAAALERATRLKPIVTEFTAARMSIRKIAAALTARGIAPPRGGSWHPQTVARIVQRTATL
jgi:DNA invertase Pin-like site-specific DNA recombinase